MGERAVVDARRGLGASLLARGFDERDLIEVLAIDSGTLVDVGANVGMYSRHFAKRGWRVLAFEPEPEDFGHLRSNTESFPEVTCVEKALGQEAGRRKLFVSDRHRGIHSVRPFHESHSRSVTVEVSTLDRELAEYDVGSVTVLKIDVEGAEYPVLKGLDLENVRPRVVLAEFMDERTEPHFGYTHDDIVEHMRSHGYQTLVSEWSPVRRYAERGEGESPHRWYGLFRYAADHEPAWGNLIFLREDADARRLTSLALRRRLLQHALKKRAKRVLAKLPLTVRVRRAMRSITRSN